MLNPEIGTWSRNPNKTDFHVSFHQWQNPNFTHVWIHQHMSKMQKEQSRTKSYRVKKNRKLAKKILPRKSSARELSNIF